jgi:signal transduction histidine kinase
MTAQNRKSGRSITARATSGPGSTYGEEKYNQFRMALEAADIGLWDWELDSNRIVMSATMKTLLDIGNGGEADSFGMFLQVIHPDDKARIVAALKKAIRQKGSFDEEFRTEKRDQAIHWMRIRGRVSVGADGAPERVMGSIHDKTERKMAFDTLASARNELEERVKDRTRELLGSNERLRREIAIKTDLQRQMMEISEKEQRRIGQDLHDSLSQQLGGIVFMGQVLFEKLKKRGLKEAQDMEKLVAHLQNALTHTRDLAKGLYPTRAKGGLVAALNELAVAVGELFAVRVTVQCEPGVNTSDEAVTFHVYRIVQEAVNNAMRHGQATRVAVRLFRKKGAVVLTVADNGAGFPEKPNLMGMGLNIMEYRASSIGASFKIERCKDRGAIVKCVFAEPGAFADLD